MRKLLFAVSITFLGMIFLTGCFSDDSASESTESDVLESEESDFTESETTSNNIDIEEITEYNQAPMLDDLDLPAAEDRLPIEPKLANAMPADMLDYEIGSYGGTIRTVTATPEWDPDLFMASNEPLLNMPGLVGTELTGNVVKDYEVSADQQEFTFYMREGMKWSDGEPVTVEDVRFTIEDFIFNEEITPIVPVWLRSAGEAEGTVVEFEEIDEYTFKLLFDQPYGGFPIRLAVEGWRGYSDLLKPAHYLQQYHADYTPLDELEPLIEEEGFEPGDWASLMTLKDVTNWELTEDKAIGFPGLYPWLLVENSESTMEFERNPYYFKIDEAGNQLPYIDRLQSRLVEDHEMITLSTLAGEVDYLRESAALNNMALYRENEENGGFKAELGEHQATPTNIILNHTYDDPVWREVVQDVRFKKALNMAIDRDEIIDAVYLGFAEPPTIVESTYDIEEANRLLDEMGMEVGPDGYRIGPDGETFIIPFETGAHAPDMVPVLELIVEFWSDLDLDVRMRTIDSQLWGERNTANELQATIMWAPLPQWYRLDAYTNWWAPLWDRWRTSGGAEGEEPPEEVKEFYQLANQLYTRSPEEGEQVAEEIREEFNKNLWFFVTAEEVGLPFIVNENLANIPHEGMTIAANFSAEQFFYRENE